jgi:hypothetical protein
MYSILHIWPIIKESIFYFLVHVVASFPPSHSHNSVPRSSTTTLTPTHPDVWLDESNPKMQKNGSFGEKK